MNKVKLNVLGLSYSQTQTGAYALVLSEENGQRRIPIIIGGFEAQAIAIELEGLKPPRPLTHDLFMSMATTFSIDLIEVNIYKLEEGIFYSEMVFDDGKKQIKLDARTSDAIALALRFKSSIYTTENILSKAGIILDFDKDTKKKDPKTTAESQPVVKTTKSSGKYSGLSMTELNDLLEKAVNDEDYEKASEIRDEIKNREKK